MAVKTNLSKAKRNNIKKNKLIKQGTIKKTKKPNKSVKNPTPRIVANKLPQNDSEESDIGEDMLQMVDEDDIEYLKNAITNRSYNFFNKIKRSEYSGPKPKRQKPNEDDTLEKGYEDNNTDINEKKIKNLLPIKTKSGIVPQHIVEEKGSNERADTDEEIQEESVEQDDAELIDSAEFTIQELEFDPGKPISAAQLLAARNEILRQRKIHIGTLSSGLLENPEEKIMNLKTLLNLLDEESAEVYLTVRKLVVVSLLEVFKDILPSYEIKNLKQDGIKLKKDTLKLQKYEETLLLYYKKFLQRLEKIGYMAIKKRGDSRKRTEEEINLSTLAVQALCDLLVTHPYFNFSQNIAQAVIPFLNSSNKTIREIVSKSIKTLFKEDKKEEITLKVLRVINNYLKNHSNIHAEMLEVMLVLNLRDVNLDQEKEQDLKQKKLMAHKSKILQMSKKERKRKKKLKEVEKELLETKAEESKQSKQKYQTEITKIIFNIYFRILKNSSGNTKILSVCLEGLAKFAHCINLEFYVDIVNVLDSLLKEDWLNYREKLHCIQTVFAILSGQGEALNLDPTRFYNSLYNDLVSASTISKKSEDILTLIKTLTDALIKRRKKITNNRTLGFIKRLATLSLQLFHDGALGCLGIIKNSMQLNRALDILLDFDSSVGHGKFQAELGDPEYANASSTAMYEMLLLKKHYHPVVNKFARNIASGVPATGEGSLPGEYAKWSAEQLYSEFCMSEMAFNPPVPVPKKAQSKAGSKKLRFTNSSFEEECKNILKTCRKRKSDFWINYKPTVLTDEEDDVSEVT